MAYWLSFSEGQRPLLVSEVFLFPSYWCKTSRTPLRPGPSEANVFWSGIYRVHVGRQVLITDVGGRLPYWGEALRENTLRHSGWLGWCRCRFRVYASTPEREEQRGAIQGSSDILQIYGKCQLREKMVNFVIQKPKRSFVHLRRGPECLPYLWYKNTEKEREIQVIIGVSAESIVHVQIHDLLRGRKPTGVRNDALHGGVHKGCQATVSCLSTAWPKVATTNRFLRDEALQINKTGIWT